MIAIRAHFDGKVLVPDDPVKLPKGKALNLQIEVVRDTEKRKRALLKLGAHPVRGGIPDASVNLDKYIYTANE